MNKEYEISQKAFDKWIEYVAYNSIMEKILKMPLFSHRRLVKFSKLAERNRIEFWDIIHEEYPALRSKSLTFEESNKKIIVKDAY